MKNAAGVTNRDIYQNIVQLYIKINLLKSSLCVKYDFKPHRKTDLQYKILSKEISIHIILFTDQLLPYKKKKPV